MTPYYRRYHLPSLGGLGYSGSTLVSINEVTLRGSG